ncbi:COX5B-domain-containing protein [Stereum hirsutum FP-91666 SS1]|uniref:COX5B-domain-containing protein n=1 Tax=Stereum hirsutum (strain FP-91666) TaxID=721885 RepID=UPI000440ED79|nr:COX5B-domain-containing protein [Stereum hirsutum FP-91666 SS1]EIM90912.1 COX5B-domain-containing protein [Stereum hirsutum FP-91666 SS1]
MQSVLRVARPASLAIRAARSSSVRTIATSAVRRSEDHLAFAPTLFGPGAKKGEVATAENQSTGLDRVESLGLLQGVEVWDQNPLDSSRIGTKKDPIKVISYFPERTIGCTGSPADSHDIQWMVLNKDKIRRCHECGSVYELDYKPDEVVLQELHPQEQLSEPAHGHH